MFDKNFSKIFLQFNENTPEYETKHFHTLHKVAFIYQDSKERYK